MIHVRKGFWGMKYISVKEASGKWGISLRQVQRLVAAKRIPEAVKFGGSWMIPANAEKPPDSRQKESVLEHAFASELHKFIEATTRPMPADKPDEIKAIAKDERACRQYEAELAYLRGNFGKTLQCYSLTAGDDVAGLRASLVAIAAAISLGDYSTYLKIEAFLENYKHGKCGRGCASIAELAMASAAVNVAAPNMVPDWLKAGDFSSCARQADRIYLSYLRSKYLLNIGEYEIALAVAQTALAFRTNEEEITLAEIYLRKIHALSLHCLGRNDEAKVQLIAFMHKALPYGFITPLAESISEFGGIVEKCLNEKYPEYSRAIIDQWERTVKNWISFHNQFAKDNITMILSLREIQLAQLVAHHVPYAEIAEEFNISVGRLKNIMLEIYEKLFVSGRHELAQYVLYESKKK